MHPADVRMKYAIVVPKVDTCISHNIDTINQYIEEAAAHYAEFIIFPETSLTGFISDDNPEHDYKYAVSIDSSYINSIKERACKFNVYVSLGFLEKDDEKIFDSVLCIDPKGNIKAHYRRISSGWHGRSADKNIYSKGKEIVEFSIGLKKYSYLLCGDLFEEDLIQDIKERKVDIVIVPTARSSEILFYSQEIWDKEERDYYIEQVKKLGTRVILSNYIDTTDNYYGGAFVINGNGIIEKQKDIFEEGILYWEDGSI